MNAKQDYPYVRKWQRYMGAYDYYVEQQIELARTDKAPANATWKDGNGHWHTINDIGPLNTEARKALGLDEKEEL